MSIPAGFKSVLLFAVALPGIGCDIALITQGNFVAFCGVSFISGITFYYGIKYAIQAAVWEMIESVERIDEEDDPENPRGKTWKPA